MAERVAVIGAGQMGNGIAHVFAQSGFDVTMIDVAAPALERGKATIASNLDRQIKKGSLQASDKDAILGRLLGKYDYGDGRSEDDELYMTFFDRDTGFPWKSHGLWWLSQFRRWGMVKGVPDYVGGPKKVLRSDIYLEAMKEIGVKVNVTEEKSITLFDGVFDGKDPDKYARSFTINSL